MTLRTGQLPPSSVIMVLVPLIVVVSMDGVCKIIQYTYCGIIRIFGGSIFRGIF